MSTALTLVALSLVAPSPGATAELIVNGSIEYKGPQRILNLWGTHEEMGLAHGYLLAPEIMKMIESYVIEERDENDPDAYRYRRSVAGYSYFDPDTYGAELRGMLDGMVASGADLYIDVMGRDLDLLDLMALNTLSSDGDPSRWGYVPGTADRDVDGSSGGGDSGLGPQDRMAWDDDATIEANGPEGCSGFAVWDEATHDGEPLIGRNMDMRHDVREGIVAESGLLITYDSSDILDNDIVSVTWPGIIGCVTCFNENNVFLSYNSANGWEQFTPNSIPDSLITRTAMAVADVEDPVGDVYDVVWNASRSGSGILLLGYPTYGPGWNGSSVIEYDSFGVEIRVSAFDSPEDDHIIATNHFIKRFSSFNPSSSSLQRYGIIRDDLYAFYEDEDGTLDLVDAEDILLDSMASTLHSVIANPNAGSYDIFFATVLGYDPVEFIPAPYKQEIHWYFLQSRELHFWEDLFPNHDPEGPVLELTHGPLVGAVTPTSARIFARTSWAAPVTIEYCTDPEMTRSCMKSLTRKTSLASDFTTQIPLTGLEPSKTYHYTVLVDGFSQLGPPYPKFKTFPPNGTSLPFKVVLMSDFDTTYLDPPVVDTFMTASLEEPAFVLIGGDFDHRDPRSESDKRQQFKDLYSGSPGYEDMVDHIYRKYPLAHVWDDHDFGEGDAFKTYAFKELALKVTREYFPLYPTSDHGIWQKFTCGQAEFFLLDSRSQKDDSYDPDGPDKSMLDGDNLGVEGQLFWLSYGLLNSTATWKVIHSPLIFNPTPRKDDSWAVFEYERQSFLKFIDDNGITGVIMTSGDIHFGGIDDGTNAGMPEILIPTPNKKTCSSWHQLGTWSEGFYYKYIGPCYGYGLLTFEVNPDRVIMEVKNDQGKVELDYTVELTPPVPERPVPLLQGDSPRRRVDRRVKPIVLPEGIVPPRK